ncbi:MFS transporter [Altericista sp. CCNU0014]|uniref:MFS transporter n=1 Tax=Altericista sp. CCNU0014 TaxID=3082949 RepID=UPI0038516A1A
MSTHSAKIPERALGETVLGVGNPPLVRLAKDAIRRSLQASTIDGIFAAIYTNATGGVLLTNFLMDLGANVTQVGLLASIPLIANLMQPLGAYFSERVASRHWYCLGVYAPSRLLWVLLLVGLGLLHWHYIDAQTLILWTLAIALFSYSIGALGSAAWLSWMAVLVPKRLRGRYFGLRNSAANLTNLIAVPLMGVAIARWPGGSVEGFGVLLGAAIVFGTISLLFQNFMADVNPKLQHALTEPSHVLPAAIQSGVEAESDASEPEKVQFPDVWMFLIYFSSWIFAFSLSAPFFNLYMLDDLNLPISQVTLYNSLMAGANLLMLLIWGRLADRMGNRFVLAIAGIILALIPPLWLFVGTDSLSIWLWLPLLHVAMGGTGAAIDLCGNNLQIGVAPLRNQATYFGWIAAAAGVSGALGTTLGGYWAEHWMQGGLLGIFLLSSACRVVALVPLAFVREHRDLSLSQLVQVFSSAAKSIQSEG